MATYRVKPGYCLHLPNQVVKHPGEELELAGDLEKDIMDNQGWKVEPVPPAEPKGPEPEVKEAAQPPQDRAVKEPKVKKE